MNPVKLGDRSMVAQIIFAVNMIELFLFCRCAVNYIGWKAGCSVHCVHGNGTGPNLDVCKCHNDNLLGHWNGSSCERCMEGWALPTCTSCDTKHVGDNCDIDCVTDQGKYQDSRDGNWGTEPVEPILSCLSRDTVGNTRAWFGYNNKNRHNVYLIVGPDNRFTRPYLELMPGGESGFIRKASTEGDPTDKFVPLATQNYGQPTKFEPGLHNKVFSIK